MLSVMVAERPGTTRGRKAKTRGRKTKVRTNVQSPVEVVTMVKASLLPAQLVTLTVRRILEDMGHRRADCRKRIKDESDSTSGGAPSSLAQLANAQPSEPRATHFLDFADDDTTWIFVLFGGAHDHLTGDRGGSVLIDSGSDGLLCRPLLIFTWNRCTRGTSPSLVDVQQQPLPSQERPYARLELSGGLTAKTDFVVALVGHDRLSHVRLLRRGIRFNLSLGNSMTMSKGHRSVPRYVEGNSFPFGAPASDGNHVVAVVDAQGEILSSAVLGPATLMAHMLTTKDVIFPSASGTGSAGVRHETSALASSV